jgi:hypothetical protein
MFSVRHQCLMLIEGPELAQMYPTLSVYVHQPVFAVPGMCLQKSLQLAHKLNRAQQRKRFVTRVDSW